MRKLPDIMAERERAELDDRDLRSRTDARLERKASEDDLKKLAARLVELSRSRLQALGLPELLLDAITDTQAITSPAARKRSLRRVRAELRGSDVTSLQQKLDDPHAGPIKASRDSGEAEQWCLRLLTEGDGALAEFLEAYPRAPRQEIRQALRKAQEAARKAQASLGQAEATPVAPPGAVSAKGAAMAARRARQALVRTVQRELVADREQP